jgi:hypothetical protein
LTEFHRIAQVVDATTIGDFEDDITEMVTDARRVGVSPVLVQVLSDRSEPPVVRVRALAMVRRALSFSGRRLTAA